jgi:hypothetical protein
MSARGVAATVRMQQQVDAVDRALTHHATTGMIQSWQRSNAPGHAAAWLVRLSGSRPPVSFNLLGAGPFCAALAHAESLLDDMAAMPWRASGS